MEAKHKRLVIITLSVIWGTLSASYFFFWVNPNSDLKNGILSYWYLICYVSTILTEPIFKFINIYSPFGLAFIIYSTIQVLIYFVTGWIIAGLVYPDKKV